MSKDKFWFIIISASLLLAFVVPFIPIQLIRLPFMLWFILFCPGMAFVRLLKINNPLFEFTLAVGLSLSLATVVATAVLYLHIWNPILIQFILIALTSLGISLQFLQQQTQQ